MVLLPASNLGDRDQVPITVWLDPATGHALVQLIAIVGDPSVTLGLSTAVPAAPARN